MELQVIPVSKEYEKILKRMQLRRQYKPLPPPVEEPPEERYGSDIRQLITRSREHGRWLA